jgi:hypothetical protein
MKSNPLNRLIGIVGTTVGGGMIGSGIQRTYLLSNRVSSTVSKLFGQGSLKFDRTTWVLLLGGFVVLIIGLLFSFRQS